MSGLSLVRLLPGFAATMMGIGLARFSFTPLAALMVDQGAMTSQEITVVAAFMMAAYILGAFSAHVIARRFGLVPVLRICLAIVPLGFLVEGVLASFWPDAIIRFGMNFAGAILMVLGPASILGEISEKHRSVASGVIFTGVGFGVLTAGSVVAVNAVFPAIISAVTLFVISVLVARLGWNNWPQNRGTKNNAVSMDGRDQAGADGRFFTIGFIALLIAYGFDAISFIPHTVYLSDFVASELGYGAKTGGLFWAIFGIGAVVGAMSIVALVRLVGNHASIELVLLIKALAIITVGFTSDLRIIAVTAFLVGALSPGIAMLVAMRVGALVGPDHYTRAWGVMTGCFAIGQFVGAAGMSGAFHILSKYQKLFLVGGVIEFAGLVILLVTFRLFLSLRKGFAK